jgi:hypothetical protein
MDVNLMLLNKAITPVVFWVKTVRRLAMLLSLRLAPAALSPLDEVF